MGYDPTLRFLITAIIERINVQPDGCWTWTSYTDPAGIPCFQIRIQGIHHRGSVRRYLYYGHGQEENRHAQVVTTCGNPLCICPRHLIEVMSGNKPGVQQAQVKNRYARLISADEWAKIIEKIEGGATQTAIAAEYGVHQATISRVWRLHLEQSGGKNDQA